MIAPGVGRRRIANRRNFRRPDGGFCVTPLGSGVAGQSQAGVLQGSPWSMFPGMARPSQLNTPTGGRWGLPGRAYPPGNHRPSSSFFLSPCSGSQRPAIGSPGPGPRSAPLGRRAWPPSPGCGRVLQMARAGPRRGPRWPGFAGRGPPARLRLARGVGSRPRTAKTSWSLSQPDQLGPAPAAHRRRFASPTRSAWLLFGGRAVVRQRGPGVRLGGYPLPSCLPGCRRPTGTARGHASARPAHAVPPSKA